MATRWLIPFKARDPRSPDDGFWDVGLPEWHYRMLQNKGHECPLARLILVKEVLAVETTHIYEGWGRPDKDDCFVYAGAPDRDYRSLTIDIPAPKGMLFLVFVLPDGTVDDWGWRQTNDNGDPLGMEKGRLIWPPNSI